MAGRGEEIKWAAGWSNKRAERGARSSYPEGEEAKVDHRCWVDSIRATAEEGALYIDERSMTHVFVSSV